MPVTIFFCYARKDESLLMKLKAHLKPLQLQGLIETWHDREINAGEEWERELHNHLHTSQIILLLISPDFMNSDYCYSVEMRQALERHNQGKTCVIPIIIRPVYWQGLLGNLQALPTDGNPVESSKWFNDDEALLTVTDGIRKKVEILSTQSQQSNKKQKETDNNGSPFRFNHAHYGQVMEIAHTNQQAAKKITDPPKLAVLGFFLLLTGIAYIVLSRFGFTWITIVIGVVIAIFDFFLVLGLFFVDAQSQKEKQP